MSAGGHYSHRENRNSKQRMLSSSGPARLELAHTVSLSSSADWGTAASPRAGAGRACLNAAVRPAPGLLQTAELECQLDPGLAKAAPPAVAGHLRAPACLQGLPSCRDVARLNARLQALLDLLDGKPVPALQGVDGADLQAAAAAIEKQLLQQVQEGTGTVLLASQCVC